MSENKGIYLLTDFFFSEVSRNRKRQQDILGSIGVFHGGQPKTAKIFFLNSAMS